MKNSKKIQGVAFGIFIGACSLALSGLVSADTHIERNGVKYTVVDNDAASVCKAIVRDQPGQLRSALYHGIRGVERQRAHTYYQCNEKNLLSFAHEVKAEKVTSYLAPKFNRGEVVTTEEVASR
ncbi:DUF3718 domain-containing protein [Simiduia curdlanivorans]|uniref:DUF3718 domain-containing protein n=1 Tax=Simiduia curdlanivorans TaxID=1492769 RepID=A0ABV8V4T8_9GAMM|nr:DUF3718 domain-containing protein [Simiduia curdlanivorans]MDN3641013.1 DUF3718 domain-containing protein [Simiduia curdlanivorans]